MSLTSSIHSCAQISSIAHNLAVDLQGRRLLDLSNYSVFLTEMLIVRNYTGVHKVRTGGMGLTAIMGEFPDLLVPHFQPYDENRHGVEHHLPTEGPPVLARSIVNCKRRM